jgi:hypothetical protein
MYAVEVEPVFAPEAPVEVDAGTELLGIEAQLVLEVDIGSRSMLGIELGGGAEVHEERAGADTEDVLRAALEGILVVRENRCARDQRRDRDREPHPTEGFHGDPLESRI